MEENEKIYFYDVQYEGGVASHYTFCTGLIPEQQIDPMIEDLLGDDMYPNAKCYILAADYNFGQISTQWAEKAIEANGGTVVGEEYIESYQDLHRYPFKLYLRNKGRNTKNPLNYGNLPPQNRIYQGFCGDFFSIILMVFIINLAELGKGAPNTQFEPIND